MQQRPNSEPSPCRVIGPLVDKVDRFESRHERQSCGDNGRLKQIAVKLAPRIVQLAPQLRNPTATDLEPLGRFGRPFAADKHFDDPSLATSERFQPRWKITQKRDLIGHGRPVVCHNCFAPFATF